VTRVVLNILLATLLMMTGGGKIAGAASSHAIRESLDVPPGRWRLIGGLELVGVIGLVIGAWVPVAGLVACAGVATLMIGAILIRRRAGEGWTRGVAAETVVLLLLASARSARAALPH
jgi:uncharacterized membrane protein YphA (DoxX/SURF4 family)